MSERKFAKNLVKPGQAAQLRENVRNVVRHSTLMVRPTICEPIDYENFITKYREILQNDPQRELLLFPMNDFTVKTIKNIQRTTKVYREINDLKLNLNSIPLYVKEIINSFKRDLHVVTFQYGFFSSSWHELPKFCKANDQINLVEQIYELDEDEFTNNNNIENEFYTDSTVGITKEGFILKGPEQVDSFISLASKSFKRRWMSLRQEIDGTCMLEFHRDSKKMESKGAICLDFCNQLLKNSKRAKFAFELKMIEGHKTCILAAENEIDYESWIDALSKAIQNKNIESRKSIVISEETPSSTSPLLPKFGTLRNLDLKKNPEFNKFQQENDYIISQQRKENRINICSVYPDLYIRKGSFLNLSLNYNYQPQPYSENFGYRFKFTCKNIDFNLKTIIDNHTVLAEPLFTSVAIYDIKRGKITEEFRFDINDDIVKSMLPKEDDQEEENNNVEINKEQNEFTAAFILNPKSAIFSVFKPSKDMYLVIRIEKIFSGSITSTSEVYLKNIQNGGIGKLGNKLHKSTKALSQKMNNLYRMPFAFAVKPLFKDGKTLDLSNNFGQIYRQESNRLSDDDLIRYLIELKNTDKLKNVTTIPGKITIKIEDIPLFKKIPSPVPSKANLSNSLSDDINKETNETNIVNSLHVPVVPFKTPINNEQATIEIQEFLTNDPSTAYPFTSFTNLLYVFPKFLKYDVQKLFPKAKNICCAIEFRDSDDENTIPIKCIFGSPARGNQEFVYRVKTAVTHHQNNPEFYEEIKIYLPTILNEKQHILFSFYHISSSSLLNKKKEGSNIDTPLGYSWMPICPVKGKLALNEIILPVSTNLPPGYLSYKPLGLSQGFQGPDIKWIDNGKEAFKVEFKLVSSIFPRDTQVHLFLVQCDKMLDIKSSNEEVLDCSSNFETTSLCSETKRMSMCSEAGREISKFVQIQHSMPKMLKQLQEAEICDLIRFFPIIMTQLFKLLITTTSSEVCQFIVKTIVEILDSLNNVNKSNVVESYVEFVFTTNLFIELSTKTCLHEELILALNNILRSSSTDSLLINKLLAHSWFFFRICIKSMICHLIETTNRIKMTRQERFASEFHNYLSMFIDLFMPEIMKRYNTLQKETKSANQSLAHFLVRLFAIMDRGFIFKLIKSYLDKFHAAKDSLQLHSLKFEFLAIVTSYEHYIPLNLPINFNQFVKSPTYEINFLENSMSISDEFCKNHFLTGVLLQEVRAALSEVGQVRAIAISVLRNLLVKHSIDDRYQSKFQQSKIASLYFPYITLILENISRIQVTGFSNSFLISSNNVNSSLASAINNQSSQLRNNIGGLSSINGSLYSLNTIGTGTISSRASNLYNSKRVSFTDKFNSLNQETSKQLQSQLQSQVQSLRRNSSLESNLESSLNKDPNYLNLISNTSFNAKKSLNEIFEPTTPKHSTKTTSNEDDGFEDVIDKPTNLEYDSRSNSPFSQSSSSSTNTLTANQLNSRIDHHSSTETLTMPFQHLPPISNTTTTTNQHQRSPSIPIRFDKLNSKEVRDLLIIYLWIIKNIDEEVLINWLKQADDLPLLQILTLGEMCLHEFRYNGKKMQPLVKTSSSRSYTLPTKISSNFSFSINNTLDSNCSTIKKLESTCEESLDSGDIMSSLLEANLATETGLIVLDLIGLTTNYLLNKIKENDGENLLMKKIFCMYIAYFSFKQSDKLLGHLFASLRLFIQKFSSVLFSDSTEYISKMCLELLKFCSSRLNSIRSDAAYLIYLLLLSNFNFTKQTAITRMQLQLIISISQLLGDTNINLINNTRFQESLSIINNYASTDKSVRGTKFPNLVKDLVKSIRKILMATMLIVQHSDDPEKLMDLQHHLANSYRETSPALRRTWLFSMSKNHMKNGNFSEAAMCLAHICALEFECLRIKNKNLFGAKDFEKISMNIVRDERPIAENTGILNNDLYNSSEQQFTEELLIKNLQNTIDLFAKAERFEIIPEFYRLLIPFFEKKRDYEMLSKIHREISENYQKILNLQKSNKRFLGKYYRVGFYGRDYFEDDSGVEFIYKEEKVTSLSEISQRLKEQYSNKHGPNNIKLIQTEKEIDESKDCDPKYGYIQITHCLPYNFEIEEDQSRKTLFEKVNNIDKFCFETPFSMKDETKNRSDIADQGRRRTICTTAYQFPYVEKRIKILGKQVQILTPIEVGIDEMKSRVRELKEVIYSEQTDIKKLHLKLGGSISVQVNAGPLAYAMTFINDKYPYELVYQLKQIYKEFVEICEHGLQLNERLITQDQIQYHESLKENYNNMINQLQLIISSNDEWEDKVDFDNATVSSKSFKIFDYISGSSNA